MLIPLSMKEVKIFMDRWQAASKAKSKVSWQTEETHYKHWEYPSSCYIIKNTP